MRASLLGATGTAAYRNAVTPIRTGQSSPPGWLFRREGTKADADPQRIARHTAGGERGSLRRAAQGVSAVAGRKQPERSKGLTLAIIGLVAVAVWVAVSADPWQSWSHDGFWQMDRPLA